MPFNRLVTCVSKPHSWKPVHADKVSPESFAPTLADWLKNAIDIGTENTLHFSAFLLRLGKEVTTSSAIPVSLGNTLQKFAAVARLVNSSQAKVANNYFIVFVILAIETGITNDIVVAVILVNSNLLIGIFGVDLFWRSLLGSVSLVNLHSLSLLKIFRCMFLFCLKLACHTLIQSSDPQLSLFRLLSLSQRIFSVRLNLVRLALNFAVADSRSRLFSGINLERCHSTDQAICM